MCPDKPSITSVPPENPPEIIKNLCRLYVCVSCGYFYLLVSFLLNLLY